MAIVIGLTLSGCSLYLLENIGALVCLHGPLILFVGFQVYSLKTTWTALKKTQRQWVEFFAENERDIWSVASFHLNPKTRSSLHCAINAEEIILVPVEEWTMSRDWPLNWVESLTLNKDKGRLELKIQNRPVIELTPRSESEARAIIRCFNEKQNQRESNTHD